MQFRTVEYVGYGVGIVAPIVGVIWFAASTVNDMRDMAQRLAGLEARVTEMTEAQVEDRLINKRVDDLAHHVDWLRYHHHQVRGDDTGAPHVD